VSSFEPYLVDAYNTAKASENKIHDDAVAQKFGFGGGLVPGVEVFAYMTHAAVEKWGAPWLERGTMSARFLTPVYDGKTASVLSEETDDQSIKIWVESEGAKCANGSASLPVEAPTLLDLTAFPTAPLPATRPAAAPESLVNGQILGTFEELASKEMARQYLDDVREKSALYATEGVVHPGLLLHWANSALSQNVKLGPWIHVGSDVQFHAAAPVGAGIFAPARVTAAYEKKGHRFVELDVVVAAHGVGPLMRVAHTAIYEPRQVRAA
jgi:hypothetical protein